MPMSPGARFKRAFVAFLLELARVYGLTLNLNCDSQDEKVKAGFRKVCAGTRHDKNKKVYVRKCLGTRPSKVHTTRNIVPPIFHTYFAISCFTQKLSSHMFHNVLSSS